jgi:hypothetical protein
MIKLPPKIGSFSVPEALTRQVLPGRVAGKKTVKPRFGSICDQSVNVVGLELAAAVLVAVAVAGVPVGVTLRGACSSRKTINALLHQCSLASATWDGVDGPVEAGVPLPPPVFPPEHDTKVKLDSNRQVDKHSQVYRQRALLTRRRTNDEN